MELLIWKAWSYVFVRLYAYEVCWYAWSCEERNVWQWQYQSWAVLQYIMTEEEKQRQEEAESQSALLAQYVHTRNLHSSQCT